MYDTTIAPPDYSPVENHDNYNHETLSIYDNHFDETVCEEPEVYDKYLNPLTDYGFKRIFGMESNSDILFEFLNDLFEGKKVIKEVRFNNTERPGSNSEDTKIIYDILCTAENGERFIIEMQRLNKRYFKDRSITYLADLIMTCRDNNKESDEGSLYKLPEIYFIGILDFTFDKKQSGEYLQNIQLMNTNTNEIFFSKLNLIFLEVPKFNKPLNQLNSNLDKWMYLG